MKPQKTITANGNEAAAKAILQLGYDVEGYYPITPSSEVGEEVSKAIALGQSDISLVIGTSELAAVSVVTGAAVAGGRAVDVTSSQGLLLKAEELPAIAGLGLPVVLNLSTREVNAPLNIKNGHSDLAAALGWGWIILMAPTVQAVYDMNIIALRIAERVNLPCIVAYDGFHTSHANRKIRIFENTDDVRAFIGPKPPLTNLLDVHHPHTFGPYMNDDLINNKVQLDRKMERAYDDLPRIFEEFAQISERRYGFVEQYGASDAEATLVILNSAGEAAKDSVDELLAMGERVRVVVPHVLRPWPEHEIVRAIGDSRVVMVAERVSQYGAKNYLANEIAASLHDAKSDCVVRSCTYGLGGLTFRAEEGIAMLEDALRSVRVGAHTVVNPFCGGERRIGGENPQGGGNGEDIPFRGGVDSEKMVTSLRFKNYYGAWPGDPDYNPPPTISLPPDNALVRNAGKTGVNLKELLEMPTRIDKHSACPGCGIFTNLNLFLRGIDGHVAMLFNTGCGMVVTTGYPLTSFKVPYFHNLFHNASSTATGVVEMIKRLRENNKLKEEITVIVVTGDGGDDIGMDQVIGSALRNDPFIMLEYDNKGYMNTGAQLCYTGMKGQRFSNAPLGPAQAAKKHHHKDIIEILRGTFAPYLFQAAESNARDMIQKARKAQATVRAGGFAFGKVLSVCPLNWGMDESIGPRAVEKCVDSCMHPLFEVEHGKTRINYNPEKSGKKIPVTEAFKVMGGAFSHLATENYKELAAEIQAEVDRRWARLLAMDSSPAL
jgi:pyruvate ferredoxin oxidoreductase alpha subunit